MILMKIGYIRVSTQEQNTIRQETLMHALEADEVYIDRMSGKSKERPELKRMLSFVRQGDTVIVESISRFAHNTRDLLELVEQLSAKGVAFVSQKEAIDTTTPLENSCLPCLARWPNWSGNISFSASERALRLPRPRANTKAENLSPHRILTRWSPSGGGESSPLSRL